MTDDPLRSMVDEAKDLMGDLDLSGDEAAFTIDDDDDDDDEDANAPLSEPTDPLRSPAPAAAAAANPEAFHPLHDAFLSSPAPAAASSTTAANVPSSFGAMPTPLEQQQQQHYPYELGGAALQAPSLDAFKAQTSRFASNLATMAQRAANQVVGGPPSQHVMPPQSPYGAYPQQQPQPPFVATSPGTNHLLSPSSPPVAGGTNNNINTNHNNNSMMALELDNEQKATLVRTHVGELITGERVIMFLSNLLHVSDSTGFSYSHTTQPNRGQVWCCAMTYYRLLLFATHPNPTVECPPDWSPVCWPQSYHQSSCKQQRPPVLQIPLASIDKVEKSVFAASTAATQPNNGMVNASSSASSSSAYQTTLMGLTILGKDHSMLRFTTTSYADTLKAHEALQTYAFPGRRNLGYLFAFESKRGDVMASIVVAEDGKKSVTLPPLPRRFDGVAEFSRQFQAAHGGPRPWAIWTQLNATYQLCGSYPSVLAGPATLDEHSPEAVRIIRQSAAFRSEYRIPALSWSSGRDGASLWRCSQPKIGLQGNRSGSDELFFKHILEAAASANAMAASTHNPVLPRHVMIQLTGSPDVNAWTPEPGCGLKILDLRPRASAMANRTGGYGYENTGNYPGSTLQFCNIGNIHAVRDSFQKLMTLCLSNSTSDLSWPSAVEDTKWYSHIRLILSASWETAFWIHVHRLPVVLHCSHGWDRTSQVAVLAQILLDPYYRTRQGFACLIEKDFLSFGHPVHTRCAHGEGRGGSDHNSGNNSSGNNNGIDEGQISPIFLQFLDCVYQLVQLLPECFEYNAKYLLILSDAVYSCRYGTFLCDTERERETVAGIRQRTHSVWDDLEADPSTRNPYYDQTAASSQGGVLLMPLPLLLRNVTLWTDRHCRYGPKPTVRWNPPHVGQTSQDDDTAQMKYAHHGMGTTMTLQENQWRLWETLYTHRKQQEQQEQPPPTTPANSSSGPEEDQPPQQES